VEARAANIIRKAWMSLKKDKKAFRAFKVCACVRVHLCARMGGR
jgi:hypothetical protein